MCETASKLFRSRPLVLLGPAEIPKSLPNSKRQRIPLASGYGGLHQPGSPTFRYSAISADKPAETATFGGIPRTPLVFSSRLSWANWYRYCPGDIPGPSLRYPRRARQQCAELASMSVAAGAVPCGELYVAQRNSYRLAIAMHCPAHRCTRQCLPPLMMQRRKSSRQRGLRRRALSALSGGREATRPAV